MPHLARLQVRVGLSIHHSVQSVALDTLVEHRLGGEACKVGGWVRGWMGRCVTVVWERGECRQHPSVPPPIPA